MRHDRSLWVRWTWPLPAVLFLVVLVSGCGTPPRTPPVSSTPAHKAQHTRLTGSWYRVKKGDTLWSVSWRAGVDYRTLARWNRLKSPYTIYPGQLLRLKPPKRSTASSSTSTARRSTSGRGSATTSTSRKKKSASTKKRKQATTALHWQWPLRGTVVSRFSYRDPDKDGIKIAGKRGQKVVAAEAGTVVYSGSGLIGYGQLIIIKHNNEFLSAYGHNSRLLVKEGQKVKRGQHISDLGVNSAGKALLHFEIRRYGKPVDPLAYLPRG